MRTESAWVCQCRRCHGVHSGRDAIQEVWESALGSCDVPIVVGVNVGLDAHVICSSPYWHGEPEQPHPLVEFGEYIVSCRPGEGTVLDYLATLVAKEYVLYNNPRSAPDDLAEELVRVLVRVRRHTPRRR